MPSQVTNTWSDVKSPTTWKDTVVDLVVPGAGAAPSRTERVHGKEVMFRASVAPGVFSAIVVSDPATKQTYVLTGGRFYISDQGGMIGAWLAFGVLNLSRSFVTVMAPNAETAAIGKFVADFSPEKVAEISEKYSSVPLATVAPPEFFVRGSQLVPADIVKFEVIDRILRLDLRSHGGKSGSFWIDLIAHTVTKAEFRD